MPILDLNDVNISLNEVCRRLHIDPDSGGDEIQPLMDMVSTLIEPRALYDVRYIEAKLEDAVREFSPSSSPSARDWATNRPKLPTCWKIIIWMPLAMLP